MPNLKEISKNNEQQLLNDKKSIFDNSTDNGTVSVIIENDQQNSSNQNWLKYTSLTLGLVGGFSALGTTVLLHNARKISQWWNFGNAALRITLGSALTLSSSAAFSKKVLGAVYKIVSNGSYIVTTLDVNKKDTVFSDNYNYGWDQYPNPQPLVAFEISAWSGFLSGIIDLVQLFRANENSPLHKILEKVQNVLDFVCPSAAAIGGTFLFSIKGLDSTTLAPILCVADGGVGTINYVLNFLVAKQVVNNQSQLVQTGDQTNTQISAETDETQSLLRQTGDQTNTQVYGATDGTQPLLGRSSPIPIPTTLVQTGDQTNIQISAETDETQSSSGHSLPAANPTSRGNNVNFQDMVNNQEECLSINYKEKVSTPVSTPKNLL